MKVYTVRQGDSLFKIAKKIYGDGQKYRQLAAYNGMIDPNALEVGQKLRIPDASKLGELSSKSLSVWHNYSGGKIWWRVTKKGVAIKNKGVVKNSKYTKQVTEIWEQYQTPILAASKKYGVPIPAIIATIFTESSGKAKAYRYEPLFYRRYIKNQKQWKNSPYYKSPRRIAASYGLVQVMYTTAYKIGFRGKPEDLYEPEANIDAGAAYIASAYQVKNHEWDPPKIACAYNAGSVRATTKNNWGMYHHPGHLGRWIPAYNGAIEVLGAAELEQPSQPTETKPSDSSVVTLQFFFAKQNGDSWKSMIVDMFKHEEQGLGDPVAFTIRSASSLEDGDYSYDLPNIAKGRYDFVFTDAKTGSVLDDISDVVAENNPTVIDLRSDAGTSRTTPEGERQKATLRIQFTERPGRPWLPVIIDIFKYEENEFVEPKIVNLENPPQEQDGMFTYDIPDVEYGSYELEFTDAETLVVIHEITNCTINQDLVTVEVGFGEGLQSVKLLPSAPENKDEAETQSESRWEKFKAFLKKYW